MKVRERIGRIKNRKSRKYGAAGILCLTAAAVLLALGTGTGAHAEPLTFGESSVDFDQDAEGNYLITSAEQLEALRNASETETEGRTFQLDADISMGDITSAASGTFAGTLDGNGHLITVNQVQIIEEAAGETDRGVLFGTITGTVENLILDIKGNASYGRVSDAGTTAGETTKGEEQYDPYIDTDHAVSELSTGEDAANYAEIHSYEEVYLFEENGVYTEVSEDTAGAVQYKKYQKEKKTTDTTPYTANAPGTDSFGIICGALEDGGTIRRVSVNGNSFGVSQSAVQNGYGSVQSVEAIPVSHYYKIGSTEKVTAEKFDVDEISIDAPDVYEEKTTEVSVPNKAVGEVFSLEVSAPKTVLVEEDDYQITYTITVKSLDETIGSVTLSTEENGIWGNANILEDVTTDGKTVSLTRTYTGGNETSQTLKVRAAADIDGQQVTAEAKVSPEVKKILKTQGPTENESIAAGILKLEVSAPENVKTAEDGKAVISYEATVTNLSDVAMEKVTVTCQDGDQKAIENLAAARSQTVTLTREISLSPDGAVSGTVSSIFSASALYGSPAQKVTVEKVSASTFLVEESFGNAIEKSAEKKFGLKVSVSAPVTLEIPEAGGTISYAVTVNNTGDTALQNVVISPDGSSEAVWTVTTDGTTVETNQATYTIASLAADASETVTFSRAINAPNGNNSIKVEQSFTVSEDAAGLSATPAAVSTTVSKGQKESVGENSTETATASKKAELQIVAKALNTTVCGENGTAGLEYEVTVTNTGDVALTNIQVAPGTEADDWTAEADGITGTFENGTYTIPSLPVSGTVTLTYKRSVSNPTDASATISESFTASGEFAGEKLEAKAEGLTTTVYRYEKKTFSRTSGTVAGGKLKVSVTAPDTVEKGNAAIQYELELTAPAGKVVTLKALKDTGAGLDPVSGQWTESGGAAGKNPDSFTVTGSGASQKIQFSYSPSEENTVSLIFEAEVEDQEYALRTGKFVTNITEIGSISSGAVKNNPIAEGILNLSVTAPVYETAESGTAVLEYELTLSGSGIGGTDLKAGEEGDWVYGTTTTSGAAYTVPSTVTGNSVTVTYRRTVTPDFQDSAKEVSTVSFSAKQESDSSVACTDQAEASTYIYKDNESAKATGGNKAISITLERDKRFVDMGGQVVYTLNLQNIGEDPVFIRSGLDGWSLKASSNWSSKTYQLNSGVEAGDDGVRKGQIIEPGASVELEKTEQAADSMSPVSATLSGETIKTESVPTYQYAASVANDTAVSTRIINSDPLYPGNHLYAGVFAGISRGTISESTQNIRLTGTASESMTNGAVLRAGGAAGRNDGQGNLSDLYIKGSVSASGTNAQAGAVAGEGDADAASSVFPGNGTDTKPDSENWTDFRYYESAGSLTEAFDLAWLVKKEGELFSYEEPSGSDTAVNVQVGQEERMTGEDLSYKLAYRARKELADEEKQLYFSSAGELPLGNSGYYQKVSAYATDGYYHYVQEYGEDEAVRYPFNNGRKPSFFSGEDAWSVERTGADLEDEIVLKLSDSRGVKMYYGGGAEAVINAGTARFPFEGSSMSLMVTPEKNGKLYESFTSREFTSADREMLPKPSVMVQGYYQSNGEAYTEALRQGGTYAQGSVILLEEAAGGDGYSYEYCITEQEPGADGGIVWSENQGTTSEVPLSWSTYEGSITVSDDMSGSRYLYVKVIRENYPETVYYYGSFNISGWSSGTPQFYYDYDGSSGTPIEGNVIMTGDILTLHVEPVGILTEAEYLISETELTGNLLYGGDWKAYEGPVTITRSSEGSNCYLYTRMRSAGSDPVYGPVSSHEYVFAGSSGSVQISPRTSDASAASVIASGAAVYLDSISGNAKILYLVNNTESEGITLERVNKDVSGLSEDGTYYRSGNRWYRVSQGNVKEYTGSFALYNDQESVFLQYVHAVALDEDMEPGSVVSYAYQVEPTQDASAPEASMETRSFPDHEEAEIAQVSLGSSLTFTSLTSGAELYYVIGNGTVEDHVDEASGTMRYDSSKGITVEGSYGSQFTISIKAVKWNEDRTKKELKDSQVIRYVYLIADQDLAVAPTATPETSLDAPATVAPGDKILLSTTTKGASVYYTTDGSAPQVEMTENGTWEAIPGSSTSLYDAGTGITMPLEGSGYFTVRAVAVRDDLGKSTEVQFVYTFPDAVQQPYANVPSGQVDEGTEIFLKNRTEGAVIYYTVSYDGSTPEDPGLSSPVYDETQPVVVRGNTVIKAVAVKDGVKSQVVTFRYGSMEQTAPPSASINSGAMVTRGTRLTLSAEDDAAVYYTVDGSDPLDAGNSAVVRGSELTIDGEAGEQVTIKAYARCEGKTDSEVVTFTYQISQNISGVTADVPNGSLVSNGSKINLMTDVTDAVIYYTTDGSSPADAGTEGTVVVVNGTAGGTFTVKAVAVAGGEAGTVATFTYRIKEKPTAPSASPSGGVLTVAARVELSSSADTIYYTTDGTTPTKSSTLYTEPVLINRTTNLKAIAVSEDGEVSEVSSFQYTAALKAGAPVSSEEDGSILEPGTVITLRTDTMDAEIYYSTDGTDPSLDNLDNLMEYTEDGIRIGRTVTIKAAAYREDMQLSGISTYNYVVETIPAVELKQAEAERLAEDGLHDSDASGLERMESYGGTGYRSRVLEEREYDVVVSSSWSAIPNDAVLITEEKEYADAALRNVKTMFGDDYVILNSYEIYLKRGASIFQPEGEVEIGIPIPEKYLDAAVSIVYINGENQIQKLDTRREGGMAYARTDHFSHYALVGLEDGEADVWSIDYLLILELLAGLTALSGILYFIRHKWRRSREKSKNYPNE